jgi:DNA-binding Lrp family transcriptional regulator
MQRAFVFVKVQPGHEKQVMSELMKHDEVREVHVIGGDWDLLALLEVRREIVAPSDETIYNFVVERIRKIDHIQNTQTIVPHLSVSK